MNLVLIVREEIICLLILFFIVLYSRLYKMGKDADNFLRICSFAIGHVVFDLITVLTVNNIASVPPILNRICHIIFYIFALLFSYEFFCYTVALCFSKKTLAFVRRAGLLPIGLYLLAVPFLPMEYLLGDGTYYSFGAAAIVGYGVAMFFFLASIYVVLRWRKKLDATVFAALLPMLSSAIAAEAIQIIVPELLFTGGAVTIITVGFFFSLENPVAVLRHKVMIDAMTGVKSRQSYDADIVRMEKRFAAGSRFGMVFCDINDLKTVNDTLGHLTGDSYIASIAQILLQYLKSAEAVYRMGGDEFLAVYQDKGVGQIEREVEAAKAACVAQSENSDYPLSMAVGYAVSDASYKSIADALRSADYMMYTNKTAIKLSRAVLADGSEEFNLEGLNERYFSAAVVLSPDKLFFILNIDTDVLRSASGNKESFPLVEEYQNNGFSALCSLSHPDEQNAFSVYLNRVRSQLETESCFNLRLRDGSGEYQSCECRAMLLSGSGGESDLLVVMIYRVED